MQIRARAPAKINLALSIKGKLKDGYHEVDMIMQTVDLFDIVTIKKNNLNYKSIKINCNKDLKCKDKENIVFKASEAFFNYTGINNPGIIIEIEKHIPLFAGLAGGSSDGAAAIVCLNEMFKTGLSKEQMENIGAKVGADIPFCIEGGTARAVGIGVELQRIDDFPDCGIVIIKPECNISTKEAYKKFDDLGIRCEKSIETMINFINRKDIMEISNYLFNDFESLIDNLEIEKAQKALLLNNPLGVCMSGSGPSVYGIFRSFYLAEICKENLKKVFKEVYACRPIFSGAKIF